MTSMQLLRAIGRPAQPYLSGARRVLIRGLCAAACLCLAAAAVLTVPRWTQGNVAATGATQAGSIVTTGAAQTGEGSGCGIVPSEISLTAPVTAGEGFSEEEIAEQLAVWADWEEITGGAISDRARPALYGFSHVSLTGDGNLCRLNYYDIPIIDGGRIAGRVTVYRLAGGEVASSLAYGGQGVERKALDRILDAHPDEALLMVYLGDFVEAVITPENEVLFLNAEYPELFPAGVDYYTLFYSESCVIRSDIRE